MLHWSNSFSEVLRQVNKDNIPYLIFLTLSFWNWTNLKLNSLSDSLADFIMLTKAIFWTKGSSFWVYINIFQWVLVSVWCNIRIENGKPQIQCKTNRKTLWRIVRITDVDPRLRRNLRKRVCHVLKFQIVRSLFYFHHFKCVRLILGWQRLTVVHLSKFVCWLNNYDFLHNIISFIFYLDVLSNCIWMQAHVLFHKSIMLCIIIYRHE